MADGLIHISYVLRSFGGLLKTYFIKPMQSHFQNFLAVVGFYEKAIASATSYFYRGICLFENERNLYSSVRNFVPTS